MKLRSCLFTAIALLAIVTTGKAQHSPHWEIADTSHYSIDPFWGPIFAAVSPSDIGLIGATGTSNSPTILRHSFDSGRSWKTIASQPDTIATGVREYWNSLLHPSASKYVVFGHTERDLGTVQARQEWQLSALVKISDDSGKTWRQISFDSNTYIDGGAMLSESYGAFAVEEEPSVFDTTPPLRLDSLYVTEDGWKTWQVTTIPRLGSFPGQLFVFGKSRMGAVIYSQKDSACIYATSSDGGRGWTNRSQKLPNGTRLTFRNEAEGWGVDPSDFYNLRIIHTTDSGNTWTTHVEPVASFYGNVYFISFADSLHGLITGGPIFRTEDGGATWNRDEPPVIPPYSSYGVGENVYLAPELAIAKGPDGVLLRLVPESKLGVLPMTKSAASEVLSIYPNPSLGDVYMDVSTSTNVEDMTVFNMWGQKVYPPVSVDGAHFHLDMVAFPDGAYTAVVAGKRARVVILH